MCHLFVVSYFILCQVCFVCSDLVSFIILVITIELKCVMYLSFLLFGAGSRIHSGGNKNADDEGRKTLARFDHA